jgi:hypothetical protein
MVVCDGMLRLDSHMDQRLMAKAVMQGVRRARFSMHRTEQESAYDVRLALMNLSNIVDIPLNAMQSSISHIPNLYGYACVTVESSCLLLPLFRVVVRR